MRNRPIAMVFVVLLVSQAGFAAVCSSDCEPAAMAAPLGQDSPRMMQAHAHHHPVADASTLSAARSLKSQDCGRNVVSADSLRAAAPTTGYLLFSQSPELGFAVAFEGMAKPRAGVPAVPSISPPHYSVLRI
jgi:hypothetical protein